MSPPRLRRTEAVMGTGATIELRDALPPGVAERLADDAFAWLHEVDRRFSTYRADSEVSRLDRGEIRIEDCSDDLRQVLEACTRLWQETDGYFDAYATGRLDPSGYVKGWAVQVASQRLTAAGAPNHLVDAGGDLQARGRPEPGEDWEIGIRHPWDRSSVGWVLAGTDVAVATSGTYERGRHVVNPLTGERPAQLRSVTVVGRDLAIADAYATTAIAMGRPALRWLARLPDHEVAVVCADGSSYISDGFPLRALGTSSGSARDRIGRPLTR
jgi:thiamine biosynthesis lipoprotein